MNLFDDFRPDVQRLIKEQSEKLPPHDPTAMRGESLGPIARIKALAYLYWTGVLIKTGLHQKLIYTNLKLDWFYEFQEYWVSELGNRPIQPHDFYFLHGVYRQ